jgi:hypothetical protein
MIGRRRALEHRITMIAVVVILQLAATLFFLVDVVGDLRANGSGVHIAAEAGACKHFCPSKWAKVGGMLQVRVCTPWAATVRGRGPPGCPAEGLGR